MNQTVGLRNVTREDLPQFFDFQNDSESNRMAVTIPRSREAFEKHWEKVLLDPNITARAITVEDELVGYISCFPMEGRDTVGYWLGRTYWGQGIASRALDLLLQEVAIRPLHAVVATSNKASLRVLEKFGFIIERFHVSVADDRFPECEEAWLILN